jgi:hypothetical protein
MVKCHRPWRGARPVTIEIVDAARIRLLTEKTYDALGSVPGTSANEIGSALATVVGLMAVTMEAHTGESAADFVDRFAEAIKTAIARGDEPERGGIEA